MPTVTKTKKPRATKKSVTAEIKDTGVKKSPPEEKPEKVEEESVKQSKSVDEGESHPEKRERYFEDVGRRKTAVARVRLFTKAGDFVINSKPYNVYFPAPEFQKIAEEALQKMKLFGRFKVSVKVKGGGLHAQAEALRHGLARCLVKFNPDFRKRLKRAGYLTRDPRMKERKKFGLKKARKAPQWAKR